MSYHCLRDWGWGKSKTNIVWIIIVIKYQYSIDPSILITTFLLFLSPPSQSLFLVSTPTQTKLFLQLLWGLLIRVTQKVSLLTIYHLLYLIPTLLSLSVSHQLQEFYPLWFWLPICSHWSQHLQCRLRYLNRGIFLLALLSWTLSLLRFIR